MEFVYVGNFPPATKPVAHHQPVVSMWARGTSSQHYAPSNTRERLLWEMDNKIGLFEGPTQEIYVPPWERSLSEVYGKESAAYMKRPVESYEKRASRFAREEAERRAAGRWRSGWKV